MMRKTLCGACMDAFVRNVSTMSWNGGEAHLLLRKRAPAEVAVWEAAVVDAASQCKDTGAGRFPTSACGQSTGNAFY